MEDFEAIWYIEKYKSFNFSSKEHIITLLQNYKDFGLSDSDVKEYLQNKKSIFTDIDDFLFEKAYSHGNVRIRKIFVFNKKRFIFYDEKKCYKQMLNMLLDNSEKFKDYILCFEGRKELTYNDAIKHLSTYLN